VHHQALSAVARQWGHFCPRPETTPAGRAGVRVVAHPSELVPVATRRQREVGAGRASAGRRGSVG